MKSLNQIVDLAFSPRGALAFIGLTLCAIAVTAFTAAPRGADRAPRYGEPPAPAHVIYTEPWERYDTDILQNMSPGELKCWSTDPRAPYLDAVPEYSRVTPPASATDYVVQILPPGGMTMCLTYRISPTCAYFAGIQPCSNPAPNLTGHD